MSEKTVYRTYIIVESWTEIEEPDDYESTCLEEEEAFLVACHDSLKDALEYAKKANGVLVHEGVDE